MTLSRLAPFYPIALCLALTSCSVSDALGPRANKEIVRLAQQAEADAASLVDAPSTAHLRSLHAEQLYAEIARLCGTDDTGAVPPSCHVDHSSHSASHPAVGEDDVVELARTAPAAGASAARTVPKESVALVVAQAIDTAATQPVEFPTVTVENPADVDAARAMLREELAFGYALGVASAFADADGRKRIGELTAASLERRAYLVELLGPHGEVPVSEAGYELGDNTPSDADSAAQLITRLSGDMVARWRASSASAASEAWMTAAIALAAQAQQTEQ